MLSSWTTSFALSALLSSTLAATAAEAQTAPQPGAKPAAHELRSDDAIKDRIEHRLATDANVKQYEIAVKVNNGAVTLDGSVASDAQKTEAARLAKVGGVTRVDNQLKVDHDVDRTLTERAKSGLTKTGESITDAWITAKVKWFFVGEEVLKGSEMSVDTSNRVVTLKGTVASAAGKARAVELAKETEGVSTVNDELTVKPRVKTTH